MTIPPRFEWQRPQRRERTWFRRLVAALVVVLVFALGVALGQALDDNPSGNGSVTFVTTLQTAP